MNSPITRALGPRTARAIAGARLAVTRGPDRGREIALGASVVTVGSAPDCDLVLHDGTVSQRHAELALDGGRARVRDLGSTNGTRLGALAVREALVDPPAARLSLGESELLLTLGDEPNAPSPRRFGQLIGEAPAMRHLFAVLERAAGGEATVLVEGESGTGKEEIAAALHAASPRAAGPLVVVDCSAIPANLVESELFGHEKGAFTGADRARAGAFETARGGTLFLDEIGELPLDLQPKFLRALERRQVKRVGGTHYLDIDVRVVAATNRDLALEVARQRFRRDLYYRLAVVRVLVPPLRAHREDVALLARHFLAQAGRLDAALTDDVLAAFTVYDWPGNVRELRNAVERLVTLGELAPPPGAMTTAGGAWSGSYRQARQVALARFQRDYAAALLGQCNGVVTQAARRAGVSRQLFHRLLARERA